MHDLASMALAQRIDDAELGRFLAGCHAALKGRADAPGGDGVHAWTIGLDGVPLFALRHAFARWVQSEPWMPTPAEIRERANMRAAKFRAWKADCAEAITAGLA